MPEFLEIMALKKLAERCNNSISNQTALIAALCISVIALDEDQILVDQASANLARLGIGNAEVHKAAHAGGWSAGQPYDAILIDGRVPIIPKALFEQVRDGGRLVAVVGDHAVKTATAYNAMMEQSARCRFRGVGRAAAGGHCGQDPALSFD